jgi:hypothetical protein
MAFASSLFGPEFVEVRQAGLRNFHGGRSGGCSRRQCFLTGRKALGRVRISGQTRARESIEDHHG